MRKTKQQQQQMKELVKIINFTLLNNNIECFVNNSHLVTRIGTGSTTGENFMDLIIYACLNFTSILYLNNGLV